MSTQFNLLTHKSRLNRPKYGIKSNNCKFLFAYFPFHYFFFKVHRLLLLHQLYFKSLPRTTKMSTDTHTHRQTSPFY